ncbi:MAG TPA: hypothetical protein VE967_20285, partial [Gemmatimonadaceae bacterium]|nr:hypothetical protein [Gemmatimonadaceae bacterium]
ALARVPADTFRVLDHLPRPGAKTRPARLVIRLAGLFAGVPASTARDALRALRFSNTDGAAIGRILEGWAAVGEAMGVRLADGSPADSEIRRWIAATGRTQWSLIMRLANAVWANARASGHPAPAAAVVRSVYRRGVRIAYRDPVELSDLAVDGDDLRAAGVPPGPELGRLLARMLEVVVGDPSKNQRDALLALVKSDRQ